MERWTPFMWAYFRSQVEWTVVVLAYVAFAVGTAKLLPHLPTWLMTPIAAANFIIVPIVGLFYMILRTLRQIRRAMPERNR